MHEIGMVDDCLAVINAKVKNENISNIKKVTILIGELDHISPEHFEFHFRERAKGTLLEKVKLSFKKIKAKFKCKDCETEFSPKKDIPSCPKCNSYLSSIIEGFGVKVESVEVD